MLVEHWNFLYNRGHFIKCTIHFTVVSDIHPAAAVSPLSAMSASGLTGGGCGGLDGGGQLCQVFARRP